MKHLPLAIALSLSVVCCSSLLAADKPATHPATAPATQPAREVKALIAQLGAEDFHDRDKAASELRKLGKDALPALKEAMNSADPEIQARASGLVRELERKPRVVKGFNPRGGNFRSTSSMTVQVTRNGKTVTKTVLTRTSATSRETLVTEGSRRIQISEDAQGIHMTVTQNGENGKTSITKYDAADPEDLQKNNPDAYKLYEQYTQGEGDGVKLEINEDR